MTGTVRKLGSLAILGCAVAILAVVNTCFAQTDESRLVFPKVPSSSAGPEESTDPPPPMPSTADSANLGNGSVNNSRGRPTSYDASQSQNGIAGNRASRMVKPQSNNGAGLQTSYQSSYQSSYQPSGPGDQSGRSNYQAGARGSMQNYQPSQRNNFSGNSSTQSIFAMKASRAQMANEQPHNMQSASYMPSNNMRMGMQSGMAPSSVMVGSASPGSVMYGSAGPGSEIDGSTPMQGSISNRQFAQNMPGIARQPVVTPSAVYLDTVPGETIGPGQPRAGARVMYGNFQASPMMEPASGMTQSSEMVGPGQMVGSDPTTMESDPPMGGASMRMGCNGDGFTNPFCNNCNGCGCGGQCTGPACGGQCMNCNGGPSMGGPCGCCGEGNCDQCDSCGPCGGHQPYGRPWILAPFDWMSSQLNGCHNSWWWGEDLTAFAGVHDFKNITDGGTLSNFGFQEGVNWGVPVIPDLGLAAQVGYEATQSQFEDPIGSRFQSFITAGVFHRPPCDEGWDAGVAFDWLHDDLYGAGFDIGQIRGYEGWQWNCRNEIGMWFATHVNDSSGFQALDQYNIFYRRQFCRCADVRFWGGFTDNRGAVSGGLVGADFEVPLAKRWAIDGGFNYLIPSGSSSSVKFNNESWNLGFNLVWYVGGTAECCCTPNRPLFNVADNGSLITIKRPTHPTPTPPPPPDGG